MPHNLSTKISHKFSSFADALSYIIKNRGITQTWLAKKTGKGREEINRYVKGRVKPGEEAQQMLANALNIDITQAPEGHWEIAEGGDRAEVKTERIEDMISEYEDRKRGGGVSQTERDLLIGFLEEQAESLAKGLRLLRQLERYRRDHHPDD